MDKIKEKAHEILEISQKIYQIQEKTNPTAIFKGKIFLIGEENDREAIFVERDYEKKDSSYYFETSDIRGVIVKRECGKFCIKACVKYTNNNLNLWFAKIRIENAYDEDIQIMGAYGGSWEQPDCEDENLIINLNSDFPVALDSMKNHLGVIYNQLSINNELNNDLYDPKMVKRLKKYNVN